MREFVLTLQAREGGPAEERRIAVWDFIAPAAVADACVAHVRDLWPGKREDGERIIAQHIDHERETGA